MAHRFKEYQPFKGDIERRTNGSMIAMESGTAFAYAIDKLQDRGKFLTAGLSRQAVLQQNRGYFQQENVNWEDKETGHPRGRLWK